jgi:hypothetical protein
MLKTTGSRLPVHEIVLTIPEQPANAFARAETWFGTAGAMDRFEFQPRKAEKSFSLHRRGRARWSYVPGVTARLVPSVTGTNVHIAFPVQPHWWGLLIVLAAVASLSAVTSWHLGRAIDSLWISFGLLLIAAGLAWWEVARLRRLLLFVFEGPSAS